MGKLQNFRLNLICDKFRGYVEDVYIVEITKTDARMRKIPRTEDAAQMFRAIIEDREAPKTGKVVDGYTNNDIYRVQTPNITPHVCRHTYCGNQAKVGMDPKTLQYLMVYSYISVTINCTHISDWMMQRKN